jgi:isoleucyl-tRNA synthetase
MAPYAPFLAEEIYHNLTNSESVHLQDYPEANEEMINDVLEKEMQTVIEVVSQGRAARNSCQIKVRQPLATMYIPADIKELVARNEWLVKEEINVKNLEYISNDEGFIDYQLKANFKKMGPRFGKDVKKIAAALGTANTQELVKSLEIDKSCKIVVDGETFKLTAEGLIVSIKDREGFTFASDKGLWVALNTTLNAVLIQEGLARELVNKIQYTRKENGFEIMDRISIEYNGEDNIKEVFEKHCDYIKSETLTDEIEFAVDTAQLNEYDINGNKVWMKITKK